MGVFPGLHIVPVLVGDRGKVERLQLRDHLHDTLPVILFLLNRVAVQRQLPQVCQVLERLNLFEVLDSGVVQVERAQARESVRDGWCEKVFVFVDPLYLVVTRQVEPLHSVT